MELLSKQNQRNSLHAWKYIVANPAPFMYKEKEVSEWKDIQPCITRSIIILHREAYNNVGLYVE